MPMYLLSMKSMIVSIFTQEVVGSSSLFPLSSSDAILVTFVKVKTDSLTFRSMYFSIPL